MKSHFKLYALLLTASLIAIALVANAFFSAKKQPTAKIQDQAPAEAAARTIGTAPAPSQEVLPAPASRETDKRLRFPSIAAAPQRVQSNTGVESNIRKPARDTDVVEANSAVSKEKRRETTRLSGPSRPAIARAPQGGDLQNYLHLKSYS